MRVRTYGFFLLGIVGILPLAIFGYLSMHRSEATAVDMAHASNGRLARAIAERIAAYASSERRLLTVIGAAALEQAKRDDAAATVDAYELNYQYFHRITVYRRDGSRWVGKPPGAFEPYAKQAIAGAAMQSPVVPAAKNATGAFAHTMILAEPVIIAGRREGAVVARMDLVGIWPPINSTRVGKSGFVRLLATDGTLLAHGDPDERRFVFDADKAANRALITAAKNARVITNHQNKQVVASLASVPGTDWVILVEQQVAEAYAGASAIRRDLILLGAIAVFFIVVLGVVFGRSLVRGLERLRSHTKTIARGDLKARLEPQSRLVEVRALAESLNDMTASLERLQQEARARERVTTFGRVAAGLAHDLRRPVEAVRSALGAAIDNPDDAESEALLRKVVDEDLPQLKEYMDDLRHLAQAGELDLRRQFTDPVELVDQVVAELKANPKWGRIEFAAAGSAGKEAYWDRRLIRRALLNLSVNAAEAILGDSDRGKVVVQLSEADDGGTVQLEVSDTGPGIPPERLDTLLEVDFASSKRNSGIGLGLGVVRQVVHAHAGKIEVVSDVGQGTVFTLTLPRDEPAVHQRKA